MEQSIRRILKRHRINPPTSQNHTCDRPDRTSTNTLRERSAAMARRDSSAEWKSLPVPKGSRSSAGHGLTPSRIREELRGSERLPECCEPRLTIGWWCSFPNKSGDPRNCCIQIEYTTIPTQGHVDNDGVASVRPHLFPGGTGPCLDFRRAFTLIELLVVIAIIAVLIRCYCRRSRPREAARRIQCTNNHQAVGAGHPQLPLDQQLPPLERQSSSSIAARARASTSATRARTRRGSF